MEKNSNNFMIAFPPLRRKQAFSFVEVILVVIILGVACAISLPNLSRAYHDLLLENEAETLLVVIRYAQSRSIMKQKNCRLFFDEAFRRYWIFERQDEEDRMPPESSLDPQEGFVRISNRWGKINKIDEKIEVNASKKFMEFFPDGQMEKMRVKMCLKTECLIISTGKERGRVRVFKE